MRDHEQRGSPTSRSCPPCSLEQRAGDARAQGAVESGGGLIEHEQGGLEGQRAREGRELAERRGQVVRMLAGLRAQLERVEGASDPPRDIRPLESQCARTERHVVLERAGKELLIGVLKHRAHASRQDVRAVVPSVPVSHPDRAGGRPREARDEPHQRGFPGAVPAEQCDALPRRECERDVREHLHRSVGKRNAVQSQRRGHRRSQRWAACATVSG